MKLVSCSRVKEENGMDFTLSCLKFWITKTICFRCSISNALKIRHVKLFLYIITTPFEVSASVRNQAPVTSSSRPQQHNHYSQIASLINVVIWAQWDKSVQNIVKLSTHTNETTIGYTGLCVVCQIVIENDTPSHIVPCLFYYTDYLSPWESPLTGCHMNPRLPIFFHW